MEDTVHKTLMFDFYGPLLTERQQDIYRMYYAQDLSFGEIGEELGISRQAVYDIVKRSSTTLIEFENKLGLLAKFQEQQLMINKIEANLTELLGVDNHEKLQKIVAETLKLVRQIRDDA